MGLAGGGYLRHIDGMRAISVLLVILFHFEIGAFEGGFVGVDVFFTISGYLIIGSIVAQQEQGRFSMPGFWGRRVRRLMPAILATVTLSLIAAALIMNPEDFAYTARQGLFGIFSVINFTLLGEVDYFHLNDSAEVFLHFWSLAVEEQFYLVFPLIAFALAALAGKARYRMVMITALIVLSVVSVIGAEIAFSRGYRLTAYYMMPTRFAQLALGGVLAIAFLAPAFTARADALPRWLHDLLTLVGVAVIVACAMIFTIETRFPGVNALWPTAGALALLYSGGRSRLAPALSNAGASYIGKLSYSLYLVHWPVWTFMTYYLARELGGVETVLAVSATGLIAALIYHFVEKPVRFAPVFSGQKMFALIIPILGLTTAFSIFVIIGNGLGHKLINGIPIFGEA